MAGFVACPETSFSRHPLVHDSACSKIIILVAQHHMIVDLGKIPISRLVRTSLKWATAHRSRLFRNRITHHRLIGDRYPQHQTVLRSEVAVPVAFGRGEVFNELYVSGI